MAINNLRNVHLSEEKVTEAKNLIKNLQTTLAEVNVNLTPDERKKYGRINEQNKLFVNRVNDFHKNEPALQTPQVDWVEFDKDFNSRKNLENLISSLESIVQNLKNAKILHDFDNYQDALVDYAYTNFMVGTSTAGYETKQSELKTFFASRGSRTTAEKSTENKAQD